MRHDRPADQASQAAQELYEGTRGPHRSSSVAIAEAFGEDPTAFAGLARGWLTGDGPCGAISAAVLVLNRRFGDPQGNGGVAPGHRAAMVLLQERLTTEVLGGEPISTPCGQLVEGFEDFEAPERKAFCARMVGRVGRILAEVLEAAR